MQMKLGIMENGVARQANGRKRKRRRRRNPTSAAKPARRRNISLASAKSILKKNGLKAVSTQANGRRRKRRKHRRNGLPTVRRNNGFFGNTKSDATQVLQLGAGALGTKAVGRGLSGFVSPFLSQVGLGQYAGIIVDAGVALFIAPWVADKLSRGSGKMVRLGGLLTVALDGVEMFAPGALSFNPFNASPIVMTGQGAAVAPAAVAQIAADVANSSNPAAVAAKVGQAMYQLDTVGAQGGAHDYAAADDLDLVL